MARTVRMREEYEDLKKDLMEEVNMVDMRMIKPAQEAKDYLQPLKKTIKKREDRKVGQYTLSGYSWMLTDGIAGLRKIPESR